MDLIDEVLLGVQIPVFLTISKKLVYLKKRPGRQVAKLPRKLKKRVSRNLNSVGKTFRDLCVTTFDAEYAWQHRGQDASRNEEVTIASLTVKKTASDNQSIPFFFRDLNVPKAGA